MSEEYILYLAFSGPIYYPLGGMDDCIYCGPSLDEARAALNRRPGNEWWHLEGIMADGTHDTLDHG